MGTQELCSEKNVARALVICSLSEAVESPAIKLPVPSLEDQPRNGNTAPPRTSSGRTPARQTKNRFRGDFMDYEAPVGLDLPTPADRPQQMNEQPSGDVPDQ